jgi:hypothetical protein
MQTYSELKADLADLGVDLRAQLEYLVDLRSRAREGIMQEKVCAGQGVLQALEVYPALELSATRLMFDIVKYVDAETKDNTGGDLVLNIHLTEATEID